MILPKVHCFYPSLQILRQLDLEGHSTHFKLGDDNSKVEGGSCKTSMQNKAVFYFHIDNFIFENKVAR